MVRSEVSGPAQRLHEMVRSDAAFLGEWTASLELAGRWPTPSPWGPPVPPHPAGLGVRPLQEARNVVDFLTDAAGRGLRLGFRRNARGGPGRRRARRRRA